MEKMDGLQLLAAVKQASPTTELVMITGYATVSTAVDAMRKGTAHYLSKPINLDDLRLTVKELVNKKKLFQMSRGPTAFCRSSRHRKNLDRPGHRRVPGPEIRAPISGRAAGRS